MSRRNKTLYLREEDQEVWNEAARLLAFFKKQSVSDFCTEQIKRVVAELRDKYNIIEVEHIDEN